MLIFLNSISESLPADLSFSEMLGEPIKPFKDPVLSAFVDVGNSFHLLWLTEKELLIVSFSKRG
jgi:hypothetical protein